MNRVGQMSCNPAIGGIAVNIDKFYNETDSDVEAFGEQLAFVYKKKNRRKGEK